MTNRRINARRAASWPQRMVVLLLALAVGCGALPLDASSPATVSAQEAATAASTEEVIVVLADGADPVAAAQAMGVEITHIYRHVFNGFSGVTTPVEIGAARSMMSIGEISPNGRVQAEAQTIPNNISRTGVPVQQSSNHLDIDSPVDADIAILDTGVAQVPDLDVVGGYNCVGRDESKWQDDEGHGTHVAGIAAAIDNTSDVVGIAPGARVWSVKVLDDTGGGSFGDVICGLDWVVEHKDVIDVINLSLSGADNTGECDTQAFHRAVCKVVEAGIPVVVAAGNQGKNAATRVPASYPEVITVSAFGDSDGRPGGAGPRTCFGTKDDTFLNFSNYGRVVDIAAPGDCVLSLDYKGGLQTFSGTSEAAPHVTGALAVYIGQYTAANGSRPTPEQSRNWLLTEGSRRQATDGVKGDPDFAKDTKSKSPKDKKKKDQKHKKKDKKKDKPKSKGDNSEKREPVLWLESLGSS